MIFICVKHHGWLESSLKQLTTPSGVRETVYSGSHEPIGILRIFAHWWLNRLVAWNLPQIGVFTPWKPANATLRAFNLPWKHQHISNDTFISGPIWQGNTAFCWDGRKKKSEEIVPGLQALQTKTYKSKGKSFKDTKKRGRTMSPLTWLKLLTFIEISSNKLVKKIKNN